MLFAVVVTGLTAHWASQIVRQIVTRTPAPFPVECRPGVRALIAEVRVARRVAAAAGGNEAAALSRFRASLGPAWQARDALGSVCRCDPQARAALRDVDLWRYAEENSVRYDAAEVAGRRRAVQAREAELFGAPGAEPVEMPSLPH